MRNQSKMTPTAIEDTREALEKERTQAIQEPIALQIGGRRGHGGGLKRKRLGLVCVGGGSKEDGVVNSGLFFNLFMSLS